ncbi:MAG: glycosyltransferase family 2 protein [Aeriscardovia sp.]|nr:glycosyltransferase family 2 protein [Aeriscardovia sp.]
MNYQISVVLPCFNAEKTIIETLTSINNQTLSTFEVIIINDGSEDKTLDLLEKFQFRDKINKVIISRPNKGFLYSLSEGIERSAGDIIARIDSDDIWSQNHLEMLISKMKYENLVLVGSNAYIIDSKGNEIGSTDLPTEDRDIRRQLLKDNMFVHSAVLFNKNAYLKTIGYLCGHDEKSMHIADYNLWVELSSIGKVGNVKDLTVKYRYQETSMSRTVNRVNNYKARLFVQNKAYRMLGGDYLFYLSCSIKTHIKILQNQFYAYCKF